MSLVTNMRRPSSLKNRWFPLDIIPHFLDGLPPLNSLKCSASTAPPRDISTYINTHIKSPKNIKHTIINQSYTGLTIQENWCRNRIFIYWSLIKHFPHTSRCHFAWFCILVYLQSPPWGSQGWGCRAQSSQIQSSRDHTHSGCHPHKPRDHYTCPDTVGQCRRCLTPMSEEQNQLKRNPDTNGTSLTCREVKMQGLESEVKTEINRYNLLIILKEHENLSPKFPLVFLCASAVQDVSGTYPQRRSLPKWITSLLQPWVVPGK